MVEFSFVQPLRQDLKIGFQILVIASSIVTVSSGQQAFESLSMCFLPARPGLGILMGKKFHNWLVVVFFLVFSLKSQQCSAGCYEKKKQKSHREGKVGVRNGGGGSRFGFYLVIMHSHCTILSRMKWLHLESRSPQCGKWIGWELCGSRRRVGQAWG